MPNRRLSNGEREIATNLVTEIRERLKELSHNDLALEWAMRRYIYIRLQHDERGTPMARRALKSKLLLKQRA